MGSSEETAPDPLPYGNRPALIFTLLQSPILQVAEQIAATGGPHGQAIMSLNLPEAPKQETPGVRGRSPCMFAAKAF